MISDNINLVMGKIKKAADNANRDYKNIEIIAVTKYVESKVIKELYENGIYSFGESKVQDFIKKYEEIDNKINWHFIGHLQKNKVKFIVDKVNLIHSVDSIKIIEELNKRYERIGKSIDILLQINISNEKSKYGFDKNCLDTITNGIYKYSNVKIKGLMAISSNTENKDVIRKEFREMKELFDFIKNKEFRNIDMKFLSMGMSNDFEIAIEEGANIVRIGRMLIKK
ncbi:MAG: YggS family pyridoxal phosphate-dependent enzyme [Clostridiales bacterium]